MSETLSQTLSEVMERVLLGVVEREEQGADFVLWALNEAIWPTVDRLEQLAEMPYREYLRTPEWRRKRNYLIALLGCCQECGSTESLQVHHLNYDRRGHEWQSDLWLLCESCHRAEHGIT